jgi:hypothetical protein
VSDAAHHCVQLRIDLLFTMSDNLHRAIEGPTRYKFRFMDECSEEATQLDTQDLVEPDGIEPTTSCLQSRRSPN